MVQLLLDIGLERWLSVVSTAVRQTYSVQNGKTVRLGVVLMVYFVLAGGRMLPQLSPSVRLFGWMVHSEWTADKLVDTISVSLKRHVVTLS